MAKIEIIKPVDQATGKRRLLDDLKSDLETADFNELRWLVAYAKSGPLHRLAQRLEDWRKKGNKTRAIFGIDQQGTSVEALELALSLCDEVFVTQERGITFHPKAYIFSGTTRARLYLGSSNLTVGGTETNFEANMIVDATLPGDQQVLDEANEMWEQLLPASCPASQLLDPSLLKKLIADGDIVHEATINASRKKAFATRKPAKAKSGLKLKPPSALPGSAKSKKKVAAAGAHATLGELAHAAPAAATGLAIQIVPHHNGEIFLSKTAINQNPSFFGFPFTGMTTPKSAAGKPYPQRDPDPVVNIQVYGAGGSLFLQEKSYSLNTVFYETKGEIRITASILVPVVPDYSILVMEDSIQGGVDYDLTIHRPDSPDYPAWEAMCNQVMPSGGKGQARRFGWF
ncbi:phospholipase D-like domain-containing protein [Vannielia sp. SX4]|uniref:phospholipase D-like domain-containing protein n=1 Tax=Vannielia sp. SX4 TaxID=3463852 RepID=UPI004059DBEF